MKQIKTQFDYEARRIIISEEFNKPQVMFYFTKINGKVQIFWEGRKKSESIFHFVLTVLRNYKRL